MADRGTGTRLLAGLRGGVLRSPGRVLAVAVFAAALASRTVWAPHAMFHPDESTVLWFALDAVRDPSLPDHGLISSYHAYQPPGLVWATLPFVAVGRGRPEFVIVGFGLLNAGAIAFLAATVARAWGLAAATVTSAFAVVGPDAFMSSWIWHPSLYTGAMAVLLAAAIRLRSGSRWWALPIAAVPGLYALVHYSGLVLYGPAAVALAASRRHPRELWPPVAVAVSVSLLAWAPFLAFEGHRGWSDLRTISQSTDADATLAQKLRERAAGARFALGHLGRALHGSVLLTPAIALLPLAGLVYAAARRRIAFPVVLGAGVLASGLAVQVVANMGHRTDVLMVWLLPLYLLAGWFVAQQRRVAVTVAAIVAILAVGSVDLERAVAGTPAAHTLSVEWAAARAHAAVTFDPHAVINALYLPCDPPYEWGSETWYLEEVLHRGDGIRAAERADAFASRAGRCASRAGAGA